MSTFRRTAREAVIFVLLASAIVGISTAIISVIGPSWWTNGGGAGFWESGLAGLSAAAYFGAPFGFGLWIIYRVIHFAVKG
jgi:hypothetical protein